MDQGTNEWLMFRRRRIGASDAPIILGVSPWSTPYELWLEKTGKKVKKQIRGNFAIDRGNRFEPAARALYELHTGLELPPEIVVYDKADFIMASLDGYSKEDGVVLEIKVAGKEVFEAAQRGVVHEKYYPQIQHQLMVTGAKENHFFVCQADNERIINEALVIAKPDEDYIKELLFKEVCFWDFVMKGIAPPMCDRDVIRLDDEASVAMFTRLREAKLKGEAFNEVKEEAIEFCETEVNHPKVACAGILMVKTKKGHWQVTLEELCKEDQEGSTYNPQIVKHAS